MIKSKNINLILLIVNIIVKLATTDEFPSESDRYIFICQKLYQICKDSGLDMSKLKRKWGDQLNDLIVSRLPEPNILSVEKPFSTEDLWVHGKNKKRTIVTSIFSKEECLKIINEGEMYAKKHEWKKIRHSSVPTTDNRVNSTWNVWDMIKNKTSKMMYPEFAKMYNLDHNKMVINEIFLVKYSYNGQRKLKYHEDWCDFSFIVALNDQFEGGGTTFKHDQKNIQLNIGDCLLFSGRNTHKGNEITSGTRYILTGFLNYGLPEPDIELLLGKK